MPCVGFSCPKGPAERVRRRQMAYPLGCPRREMFGPVWSEQKRTGIGLLRDLSMTEAMDAY
eukprot:scaffold144840_cov133-Phaeocystis_antarctica.AAC.1